MVATAVIVAAATESGDSLLSVPEAVLLGAVEGITEFLPVSSTGHLTITQRLLGLTETPAAEAAAGAYAIAIQAGAIVAVFGLYRRRILATATALVGQTNDGGAGGRLAAALFAGFVPAGVTGFLLGDLIKEHLLGLWPTVAAWAVGGVVILVWSRLSHPASRDLEHVRFGDGLFIGVVQIFALWPGVSRSLVTILAAIALGFRTSAAVEFSFLLGLVTLGVATVYEGVGSGALILNQFGIAAPLAGFGAALVTAAGAIVWLVAYVQCHSLAVFGWYRLGAAAVVTVLVLTANL
ncbi:MAG: undecaprenyl-diphosphate phosphatase [Actinobacteria bacterium]|nr:undecaprenyl-diphosphate phosphatase [Actinomycetota bacterium]